MQFLSPPQAPSNYKDRTKIREYEESQLSKLAAEGASTPVIASLISLVVEEMGDPDPVFQEASSIPGQVSREFLAWLQRDDVEIALLYGFDAEVLLEIAALENLAQTARDAETPRVPFQLWKETGYIKDPYRMLCRAETRKMIALPQLVKFLLGTDFDPRAFTDPREQIRLARAIVRVGQLPGV